MSNVQQSTISCQNQVLVQGFCIPALKRGQRPRTFQVNGRHGLLSLLFISCIPCTTLPQCEIRYPSYNIRRIIGPTAQRANVHHKLMTILIHFFHFVLLFRLQIFLALINLKCLIVTLYFNIRCICTSSETREKGGSSESFPIDWVSCTVYQRINSGIH